MRVCSRCHMALADGTSHCSRDGSPGQDAGSSLAPGTRFAGRFEIVAPLGAGATGAVYRARDSQGGGADVALKVLSDQAFVSPAERGKVKRELSRLPLLKHPNIAAVVASGEEAGKIWVARELVDGENLAAQIARDGAQPVGRVTAVGAALCGALIEAHKLGVLHRDLKPSHVLFAGDTTKIIDFGVPSKVANPDPAREIFGTLPYVAPEQAAGKLTTFRADLYGLGATLFEALLGKPHIDVVSLVEYLEKVESAPAPEPTSGVGEAIPAALASQIRACLSREVKERPLGAKQLKEVFDSAPTASPAAPAPAARGTAPPPPSGLAVPGKAPAAENLALAKTQMGLAAVEVAEAVASTAPAPGPKSPTPASAAGRPAAKAPPAQAKPTLLGIQGPPGSALGKPGGGPKGVEWARTVLGIPQGGPPGPPASPTPVVKPEPTTESGAFQITDSMIEPPPGASAVFDALRAKHDPNVDSMAMTLPMQAIADVAESKPARPYAPPAQADDSIIVADDLMSGESTPRPRPARTWRAELSARIPVSKTSLAGIAVGLVVLIALGAGAYWFFGRRSVIPIGPIGPIGPTPAAAPTAAAPAGTPSAPVPQPPAKTAAAPSAATPAAPAATTAVETEPVEDGAPASKVGAPPRGGATALLKTGSTALRRRDYDGARRSYADAIRFYPQHSDGYSGMGDVALAQKRYPEAARHYQKAVDLRPRAPAYHTGLGLALSGSGDRNGAIAAYRRALAINPRYASARRQLVLLGVMAPAPAKTKAKTAPRPRKRR